MKYTYSKILTVFITIVSICFFACSQESSFTYSLLSQTMIDIVMEMAIVFLWLVFTIVIIQNPILKIAYSCTGMLVFLWMHGIFLVLAVASFYIAGLTMFGFMIDSLLCKRHVASTLPIAQTEGVESESKKAREGASISSDTRFDTFARSFLCGCLFWIILICIVSAIGEGEVLASLVFYRVLAICVGLVGLAYTIFVVRRKGPGLPKFSWHGFYRWDGFVVCIILAMLLFHAGRMNSTVDYDSLRYSLRSESVLIGTKGIYSDLGLVNDVYVYPKGLEILTLPLNSHSTYGAVLSFSFVCALVSLALVYLIVRKVASKKTALLACMIFSVIPAIMNMAESAKTDSVTLTFQLMAIYFICSSLEGRRSDTLVYSFLAFMMTLVFKPTSYVFSGMGLVVTVIYLIARKACPLRASIKSVLLAISSLAMFILVTARTYILTGYPIVSVFTSIFEKLGFGGLYPFVSEGFDRAASRTQTIALDEYIDRLFAVFVAPSLSDEEHIYIAWCGVLIVLLMICIAEYLINKKYDHEAVATEDESASSTNQNIKSYILFMLLGQIICLLYSLNVLYQVDGNYFMLMYVLTIISAFVICSEDSARICKSLAPAILYSIVLTFITSWGGFTGLTKISDLSNGYYSHGTWQIDYMRNTNQVEIYAYLAGTEDPKTIAMSDTPYCYMLPGCVQSFTDIEGSGGNVMLVYSRDIFKQYLVDCGFKYIYANADYLQSNQNARSMIESLTEAEEIEPVVDEEGNILYVLS